MNKSAHKYEYSETTNTFLVQPAALVVEMNKKAKDGWRVISMFRDEKHGVTIYYEREVEPGTS